MWRYEARMELRRCVSRRTQRVYRAANIRDLVFRPLVTTSSSVTTNHSSRITRSVICRGRLMSECQGNQIQINHLAVWGFEMAPIDLQLVLKFTIDGLCTQPQETAEPMGCQPPDPFFAEW